MSSQLRGVVRNGRIETDGPVDWPDGTAVVVAPEPDDGPETPDEIARVLAAMASLQPLDILGGVAADLDAWERGLRQHGIDRDRTGDSPE